MTNDIFNSQNLWLSIGLENNWDFTEVHCFMHSPAKNAHPLSRGLMQLNPIGMQLRPLLFLISIGNIGLTVPTMKIWSKKYEFIEKMILK